MGPGIQPPGWKVLLNRRDSIFTTHGTLVLAALAAADLLAGSKGWRLREAQFYVDLFANWLEFGKQRLGLSIQIVQLQRYLEKAEKNDEVSIHRKGRIATYRYSDKGFASLVENLVGFERLLRADELVFLTYLLNEYQAQLLARLLPEGRFHSKAHRAEMMELIDPNRAVKRQIALVEGIRMDLITRVEESDEITAFVVGELQAGKTCEAVIEAMDQRFSYQLSGQRSFRELFAEVPKAMLEEELTKGFTRRNKMLFAKLLDHYSDLAGTLKSL